MISEDQRTKLTFDTDRPVCDWMKEWSEREQAEIGMLMQPYITHDLVKAVKALTEQLKRMNDMSVAEVDSLKKLLK